MAPVHPGSTLRSQEVRRSKKSEKKIPEKPDFPDPDGPDRRPQGAIGGPRATCSQNFRPLALMVPENTHLKTIIIYQIKNDKKFSRQELVSLFS